MTFAAADLTSLASMTSRQLVDRGMRMVSSRVPSVHMAKATGLGLVLPVLSGGDASNAPDLYRGIFEMGGCRVILRGASVYSLHDPRPGAFDDALHSFHYLHDLRTADGQLYRAFARGLVTEWQEERAYKLASARNGGTLAARVINWIQCAPFLLNGASRSFEAQFFASLTSQVRLLMRHGQSVQLPAGRLMSAIAMAYGSFGTTGMEAAQKTALQRLASELDQQILADGGHVSRNGEVLCDLLALLLPLRSAMQAAYIEVPHTISAAIERMIPMLRFLRHADGRLAAFQGVARTHRGRVKAILDADTIGGRPLVHAQQSGFARLAHGNTTLIIDTGQPALPGHTDLAAASTLAFELCDGGNRIVVNCGNRPMRDAQWQLAARQTSAHSTICLDGADTSAVIDSSLVRRIFSNAALLPRGTVEADVSTDEPGSMVNAQHTCYERDFGLAVQRRIFMCSDGADVRGEDNFVETGNFDPDNARPEFNIRFHLHPAVKANLSRDGASVMLVLPNKTGWKFSARGGRLALEPSIYLPDMRNPRPSEQIVISGIAGRPGRLQWAFKRIHKTVSKTSRPQPGDTPELPLDAG